MIQEFYDKHIFLYIMGGLCGLGVFLKCTLLILYNKLIFASENMTHTKKSWLKNMKLRFESSYQLQLGVNDVDTYVDKYVSKIKCGGLLLSTWENISGQMIGLCLLTGSFAGILGYIYDCGQGPVLFTFFTGAWTAIIVNIVDNIVNISAHKQMLRFNLIDYFENNLKVRMEQEVFHADSRRKYQREYFDEDKEALSTESIDLHKNELRESRATAATLELREKRARRQEREKNQSDEISKASKVSEVQGIHEEDASKVKVSKSERRESIQQAQNQDNSDQKQSQFEVKEEKEDKKQQKLDAKAARKKEKEDKKQQKLDAKAARKKEKIDAIEAKKHSKLLAKQALINKKIEKKEKREELREAKERAEIEALQAKRKLKEEEKAQREKVEKDRKQKEMQNNKAFREKMRLKEEKEREAAKREEEINRMKEAKKSVKDERTIKDDCYHEIDESLAKEQVKSTILNSNHDKSISKRQDDLLEEESIEFDDDGKESLNMTAISKEEDMLIEEVLKDFLF